MPLQYFCCHLPSAELGTRSLKCLGGLDSALKGQDGFFWGVVDARAQSGHGLLPGRWRLLPPRAMQHLFNSTSLGGG